MFLGTLQERIGERYGLYICSLMCLIGGLIITALVVHKWISAHIHAIQNRLPDEAKGDQDGIRENLIIGSKKQPSYKSTNISVEE